MFKKNSPCSAVIKETKKKSKFIPPNRNMSEVNLVELIEKSKLPTSKFYDGLAKSFDDSSSESSEEIPNRR